MYDPQPPTNGQLRLCREDGKTVRAQSQNDSIFVCAVGFGEPPSGVRVRLSISIAVTNASRFQLDPLLLSLPSKMPMHVALPRLLSCGALANVTVTAVSGAGLAAPSIEMQLRVDCTPPVGRSAGFRPLARSTTDLSLAMSTAVCIPPGHAVSAFWKFDEPEETAVEHFFAITHNPRLDTIERDGEPVVWRSVGPAEGAVLDSRPFRMAPQQQWLHVRACNEAGLCSEALASQAPLLISPAAPSGDNASLSLQELSPGFLDGRGGAFSRLDVSWNGFQDPTEAAAALSYEVCVGEKTPFLRQRPFSPFSQVRKRPLSGGSALSRLFLQVPRHSAASSYHSPPQRTEAGAAVAACCFNAAPSTTPWCVQPTAPGCSAASPPPPQSCAASRPWARARCGCAIGRAAEGKTESPSWSQREPIT